MAEHIDCRNCDSWYCDGCNLYRLSKMLDNGKFDCLMDEHHSINTTADVVEVVRCKDCRHCERGVCYHPEQRYLIVYADHYCGYGAKMDGKGEGE